MKVLLLAHAFPPYNSSGSVRAAKLAEHLLASGHDVRVLSGQPHAYPQTLTSSVPSRRVMATPWWRIEAPLDTLRLRLGKRVSRETPGCGGGGEGGAARPSVAMRSVVAYRSLVSIPDAQAGWIGSATCAGKRLMSSWKPDLIYSTALPFSSHIVAARLARAAGVPWVGEFRDLYSGNPYSDVWPLRARLDVVLERRVMASAAAVISISAPLTEYLSKLHGKPATTIMNGYDPDDFARAPDMASTFDPTKTTLVYTGIIYPGRRDPAVLFEALRRLGHERHRFEVRFYGPSLDMLMAAAKQVGVADVVRTFAPVPYLSSLGLQRAADVLLLLLWDSPLERGVLTGKLFEYIGAARPVLSLGCVDGAAASLVRDRGLGLTTTDPDAVAAFLRELNLRQGAAGRTLSGVADRSATIGLTRTDQFEALEAFLAANGLLTAPSGLRTSAAQKSA